MKRTGLHITLFLLLSGTILPGGSLLSAQEKLSLDGYVSDMLSYYDAGDDLRAWENSLHNRLNLHYYPTSWLSASVQLRTRLLTGNTLLKFSGYTDALGADPGWLDLSFADDGSLGDEHAWALTSAIDRLWLEASFGNVEIKLGRQRINWGQTLVWNPNDIFNSYSYFEVDYPERPGSDALRLTWYTGMASALELAAKLDSADRVTAALYYRFNALGMDIQALGGVYQEEDLFLGTGLSGNISSVAIRGELSYFRDLDRFNDTTGYLMSSFGVDYTTPFSLWIQLEGLYSAFAEQMDLTNFLQLYSGSLDVKSLGFTKWAWFASLSYPLTPLLNLGAAVIWYPAWKGAYLSPSFDWSLSPNINLSLLLQYFTFKPDVPMADPERSHTYLGFLGLKWNF